MDRKETFSIHPTPPHNNQPSALNALSMNALQTETAS